MNIAQPSLLVDPTASQRGQTHDWVFKRFMPRAGHSFPPDSIPPAYIRTWSETSRGRQVAYLQPFSGFLSYFRVNLNVRMQTVGKSTLARGRNSMSSAKRLRFGGRMMVTLKELDAAAANMKLCTVQASYLRSEPTYGMLILKLLRIGHQTS